MNVTHFTPFGSLFCAAAVGVTLGVTIPTSAFAASMTPVDVELSLLVDGSSSISRSEFDLQRQAYVNIFSDPNLFEDFISKGSEGAIAVNFIQFASQAQEEIGWTLIDSAAASLAFADQIQTIVQRGGGTNFAAAIALATDGLLTNDFDGKAALSIDISTDGQPNNRLAAAAAATDALNRGVDVINAIAVGRGADVAFLQNSIIGGTNASGSPAFVVQVDSFDDFEAAVRNKIISEVTSTPVDPPVDPPTDVPEPVSTAGLALAGVWGVGSKLKRRSA